MEKILLAIDSSKINMDTLDFACHIANITNSTLIGVFLVDQLEEETPVLRTVFGIPYAETVVAGDIPENRLKKIQCDRNIALFEEGCRKRGVHCTVHVNKGVPASELIKETRFADLLIIDAVKNNYDELPGGSIREILAKSECPVAVAPPAFRGIDEIIFAYDGSASAVFAIRQFTHFFQELTEKKITVLQVNEDEDTVPSITNREKIGELLKTHYSSIGYHLLHGTASEEILNYLQGRKNAFVVMGAFGRNMLSAFFKRSTAELLLDRINLPLFIAHR